MVFSSLTFLCVFLPLTFLGSLAFSRVSINAANGFLIVASLLFYAYGEPVYVLLMLASVAANYCFGLMVRREGEPSRLWMTIAVAANLGTLATFKYAGFFAETVRSISGLPIPVPTIALPLGISFYTFQALSYVVDVYRGDVEPQRRFDRVLLYISLFPQLVAGPIVKYHDIEDQMEHRELSLAGMEAGLRRFACGLAKKVFIANTVAAAADALFAEYASLDAAGAWVAAGAYALQIYFDFSGYSDMAIGLGRLFGFEFQENFAHPYASTSIKEFWRRWHISLSTWFKEYLYIPLGGNRKGPLRTGLNKAAVFLCCGLWHGASWTFVVWGLIHGAFSLLEEVTPLRRLPKVLGHLYAMLVVVVSFVIFRAESLGQAWAVIATMFSGFGSADPRATQLLVAQLTPVFLTAAAVGIVIALPIGPQVSAALDRRGGVGLQALRDVAALVLLVGCVTALSSGTYNPFIYFRF